MAMEEKLVYVETLDRKMLQEEWPNADPSLGTQQLAAKLWAIQIAQDGTYVVARGDFPKDHGGKLRIETPDGVAEFNSYAKSGLWLQFLYFWTDGPLQRHLRVASIWLRISLQQAWIWLHVAWIGVRLARNYVRLGCHYVLFHIFKLDQWKKK